MSDRPESKTEARVWRLELNGTVETVAGYVYLHAKSVTLVRREKDDTPAP